MPKQITTKAKIGRPPKSVKNKRSIQVKVTVTVSERDELQRAAAAENRTVGDWAHLRLLECARAK